MSYKTAMDFMKTTLQAVNTDVPVEYRYIQEEFPDIFAVIKLGRINRASKTTPFWNMTLEVYFVEPDDFFGDFLTGLENVSVIGESVIDGDNHIDINQFAVDITDDIKEVDYREIRNRTGVNKKYFVWSVPFYIKFKRWC